MTEVILHVYDVTSSASATTNNAVVHINELLRGGIRLGGIFHSAVEVYDCEEWSFGYASSGSGVFSCPRKENPLYSYRESISLGQTSLSRLKVTQVLFELGRQWPGDSYDLLSRNCNHFCDAFSERLGVQKLPAWINRFAHAGVAAVEAIKNTMKRLRQAKSGIVSASKVAYHFLVRVNSNSAYKAFHILKLLWLERRKHDGKGSCGGVMKLFGRLVTFFSLSSLRDCERCILDVWSVELWVKELQFLHVITLA